MQPLSNITALRVDGESGPVMLIFKRCGCWFNFRARRAHKCELHKGVQSDYILKGGRT